MPPLRSKEAPDTLRPYIFHGIALELPKSGTEVLTDCPMCGRENKFSVTVETGQYHCFICNEAGNCYTFIRWLWDQSLSKTSTQEYQALATERRLLFPETFITLGLCKSIISGQWLLPGYSPDGKMSQLYKYSPTGDRSLWMLTPTLGHKLLGMNLFDPTKPIIDLCEGIWDMAAWWETIGQAKEMEEGLMYTANRANSMLAERNVLGVPTCSTFFDTWAPLFAGKVVNLLFDNDHPTKHQVTEARITPAAYANMKRVAGILTSCPTPPFEVNFLQWSESEQIDHSALLPHGYDLRDAINA